MAVTPNPEQWSQAVATQQEMKGLLAFLVILTVFVILVAAVSICLQVALCLAVAKQGSAFIGILQASKGWANVAERASNGTALVVERLEQSAVEMAARTPVTVVVTPPPERLP